MKTALLAIALAAAARLPAQDSAQGVAPQEKGAGSDSAAAVGALPDGAKFARQDVNFSSRLFSANAAPSNGGATAGAPARLIAFAEPGTAPSRLSDTAGLALQTQFPYNPALHAEAQAKSAENEGAPVKMEPFHVSESRERAAAEAIDQKSWEEAAKKFSLRSGGRFWKGSIAGFPVEVGLWGHKDLLPTPARATSPGWDFIKLQW
jgi:hypothetical protein